MRKLFPIVLISTAAMLAQSALAQEGERPTYSEASAATAPVADAYLAAYTTRDWDTLEPLLAAGASFVDPTATYVFGDVRSEGAAAMMERFRVGYAGLTHMSFVQSRRIVAGDTAVYEGELDWGLDIGGGTKVSSVTPMVIVVTVEDGKVVKHRDFVDYAPFLAAVREARGQ